MASRMRRAISSALSALLIAASLVLMPNSPAQALEPTTDSSCLIINDQHELVSADFCTGDIVVPASVTTIKNLAFFYFKGAVSFEANSQLHSIERGAFYAGYEVKSIVFPPSLTSMDFVSIAAIGNNVLYFEAKPGSMDPLSIWQSGTLKIVQPRGDARIASSGQDFAFEAPFQIDCNSIDGGKDFVGRNYVAIELHNCLDPRKPSGANPPTRVGYILNKDINESVYLQSADGLHRGTVRLRQLGDSGMRLATTQEISGAGFSISAFGDQYDLPANSPLSCQLSSNTPLPAGVTLSSDCKLEATTTAAMSSSTTDITINWVAHHGASNAFDVARSGASPTEDMNAANSVGVRLSLRKISQLIESQLFGMKLQTARFSGTIRDWNLAIDSYRALPSGQVPAGSPDLGILAVTAVEQYENGAVSEAAATGSVDAFAGQAAPQSTMLASLRSRMTLQSATNLVLAFETTGARVQQVRQRIIDLPASTQKDELWSRFEARANTLLTQTTSVSGGTRTLVYTNPYRIEEFTVPNGVTQLTVQIQGAEGSQGGDDSGSSRPERVGFKGQVAGVISVVPGQKLTIGVGEAGGQAPADCRAGQMRVVLDLNVAKGGTNPFGGYAGGNGGTPGRDGCSGYGGAGGAASVVKIGSNASPSVIGTIVAAGAAGSSGSSDRLIGLTGLSAFNARADNQATSGQSARALWYYSFPNMWSEDDISDGGALAGAGGGALGGATGNYDEYHICGERDYCPLASAPGANSTDSVVGLTTSYVPYAFDELLNSNGKVTISFVEPPASANPGGAGCTGGGTASPTPTGTPTPGATTSDAPADIKLVPFWKGAEVSWKAPSQDGGSLITSYEVTASSGQTCKTEKLTCRITGLKPGQLIQVWVTAKSANGLSGPPARPAGPKVFTPLSLNLWQVKMVDQRAKAKPMPAGQLTKLQAMLVQDVGGFTLTVRVAKNASKFSANALRQLLADEVKAVTGQLLKANLRGKLRIETAIVAGNPRAKHPSVVISSRKP